MNAHGRITALLALLAGLAHPPLASAHRLDEYLQATRLSIGLDKVDIEIDLTPGVAAASRVFAAVDANGDGQLSEAEGRTYAQQVLSSVTLRLDHRTLPVKIIDLHLPQFRDMNQGVGTIRIRAVAGFAATSAGSHKMSFLNQHMPGGSVYLVNALVPENPRIQLGGQQRDQQQHGMTLDYHVAVDPIWLKGIPLAGGVALSCLWLFKRRRTPSIAEGNAQKAYT